ncbi:MAG: GTP cyclohydrolase, FolE2/MptA family [Candidatus Omnitrophica bacterium]|nr:GTP cyclohydrolase, FolE2/MptA family [Candidatus Omnitrophota bacterium]
MKEKRYLADVGMKNLPFPMKVTSKVKADGQFTVANISINARVMQEFEAGWIDKFIEIVHQHRDRIGTKTLRTNIKEYIKKLHASTIRIDFDYPYFIEKLTPVSKEKCLVRYFCTYSAKISSVDTKPVVIFKIQIPAITTYPASTEKAGGLFGQLSIVEIEVESKRDIYPEDLVRIVDRHALVPVYSFLTKEDQNFVIQKVHSEKRTSVIMTDEIKNELAHNSMINWYSIRCSNFGMLHSYSTIISTEKSAWIPWSGYDEKI